MLYNLRLTITSQMPSAQSFIAMYHYGDPKKNADMFDVKKLGTGVDVVMLAVIPVRLPIYFVQQYE